MANRMPGVWAATWEHMSICELCLQWGNADLGELQCQLRSRWYLDMGCCQEPHMGLWLYCSLNLCWYLWSMLPQKVTKMIRIRASTWVLLGAWGLYCLQALRDLGDMDCHLGTEMFPGLFPDMWVCCNRVCTDVQRPFSHWMLMFRIWAHTWSHVGFNGHVAIASMFIWVTILPTRIMVTSGCVLLRRTMSRFMVQPQLGFYWCSWPVIPLKATQTSGRLSTT